MAECKKEGCARDRLVSKPEAVNHPSQEYCCFICWCVDKGIEPTVPGKVTTPRWSAGHAAICDMIADQQGFFGTPEPPLVPDNVVLGYN